ncbi:MAG: type IV pilin, partial [Thermoplasmatota archaeon]
MRSLAHTRKGSKNSYFRRFLGVSEAVGTVLLLGISITIAGGIALWTANIDEGEEGLYVDLWATVRGQELVIIHRGGDRIDGTTTEISISDPNGGLISRSNYFDLSGTSDETWDPGEELTIDINDVSIPDIFKVVVTADLESGTSIVILSNEMFKTAVSGILPDLAVTRVQLRDSTGTVTNTIYEDGIYHVVIRVDNQGTDMTTVHMQEETGNRISNLRIFDSDDPMDFAAVDVSHFDSSDIEVLESDPSFGILRNGEYMIFDMTWAVTPIEPRSLGIHTLNVKVIPVFNGELNYRNNYIDRKFRVDKELTPVIIHGPDPGIYDIYFSNDAPNSGEEVTVTVVVQNSGDEPIEVEDNVNLIVSTWEPILMDVYSFEIPDWKMDYDGHYGNWRSEDNGFEITDDDTFPTCVKTDIELLPGAYLFFYFTLEARVDVPGGEQWVYAAIDGFRDSTEPQGISFLQGDDPGDNKELGKIQVLPRIMVVDDDNAPTGTEGDMTSSILESLVGAGVTIDKLYVAQQVDDLGISRDAPAFTYNQEEIQAPAMEDYDIVIWVTGYDQNPLTNHPKSQQSDPGGNIQEIMEYMDSNRYFMLIGTSSFDGFEPYFDSGYTNNILGIITEEKEDAGRFLYRYLGIKQLTIDQDLPVGTGALLYGMDTGTDGLTPPPGPLMDYTIELIPQTLNNLAMTYFLPRDDLDPVEPDFETPVGVLTTEVEKDEPVPLHNTVRAWSTPESTLHDAQYRSVVIGWDITQIKYLNEKIDLIANILKWFDWKVQVGRDLSVTRMNLYIITEEEEGVWTNIPVDDDNSPKYLDTVLLEAYVRNNGPAVESTSIMFYVTGPDGVELPITPNIPDPRIDMAREEYDNPHDISGIIGQGGEEIVYKLWLAVGVGTYTFRVVVDPFHLITEINEENNDISYSTSTITSFVTKNNILVVDDDFSFDNFDPSVPEGDRLTREIDYSLTGGEPSQVIMDALMTLGYDYDEHTVEMTYDAGSWDYSSSLSILDLKRFNSVIWVTGDAGPADPTGRETFTDQDLIGLKKYLDGDYPEAKYLSVDHHENLMMVGSAIISDLMTEPDYNIDYMSDGV